jgi:rubredoxin
MFMMKPKVLREKVFQQVRRGSRFPMTGAAQTAGCARKSISNRPEKMGANKMSNCKLFRCIQCGFEYDEALGWPEDGIAPGTRWDDIPEDWSCPDCGAAKSDFEMVEVARS